MSSFPPTQFKQHGVLFVVLDPSLAICCALGKITGTGTSVKQMLILSKSGIIFPNMTMTCWLQGKAYYLITDNDLGSCLYALCGDLHAPVTVHVPINFPCGTD